MRAVAAGSADATAIERLSALPTYNAQLRTTCVATMLDGGHAENALPQVASATVNCRILPGGSPEEVQAVLEEVLVDEAIAVIPVNTDVDSPPSPLNGALFAVIEEVSEGFWPGVPVIPAMSAGATDSRFLRNAGIPAYGHTGFVRDVNDVCAHGQDKRIGVDFHTGVELSRWHSTALHSGSIARIDTKTIAPKSLTRSHGRSTSFCQLEQCPEEGSVMATTLAFVLQDQRSSRQAQLLAEFRTSPCILRLFERGRGT